MNNKPEFLQTIQRIADQSNMYYLEAYKISADEAATRLILDNNTWHSYVPGMILWLADCASKMYRAKHIGGVVETMMETQYNYMHSRLSVIENIIECSDEDLQLFDYSNGLPVGCSKGGLLPDELPHRMKEYEQKLPPIEEIADDENFLDYYCHIVTMVRSENYCLFINAWNDNWCRNIYMLPTWREMYADDIKTIETKRKRRRAKIEAQLAENQAQ